MKNTAPLLATGLFGTHLVESSGIFSFTGAVPSGIRRGGYSCEKDGISAFVSWFKAQDTDFQQENIANLREDVFRLVLPTNRCQS